MKHLEYKGEKLPVECNWGAIEDLQEETGKTDLTKLTLKDTRILCYYSLKEGHRIAGKELKYTLDDLRGMMGVIGMQFTGMLPDFLGRMTGGEAAPSETSKS